MGLTGREKLRDYAEAVASPAPAPGGGSVAAVCAALSAALARMVARIALDKEEYRSSWKDLTRLCKRSEALQRHLLELAEDDSKAYAAVVGAFAMRKDTPAQRSKRREKIQSALKKATEVPLETMEKCLEVLELSKLAMERGSREAFTDAGSAALIAHASLKAAALNVKVNIKSIDDSSFARRAETKMVSLLVVGEGLNEETSRLIDSRLS